MRELVRYIAVRIEAGQEPSPTLADRALRARTRDGVRISKRDACAWYASLDPAERVALAGGETVARLVGEVLRVKPGRTRAGVAPVAILCESRPCRGRCVFCPDDASMPKSYLSNEPACQRGLLCGFDPYEQVAARLDALEKNGHVCDRVELMVLGGTWDDYPKDYRDWFVGEAYRACGDREVVGLSVETRPDAVDVASALDLRALGVTRVQLGVQSLSDDVLERCRRGCTIQDAKRAFGLLRLLGFKLHGHLMLNLPGADPASDVEQYRRFVTDPDFMPDEVKLYPCVAIPGTELADMHVRGEWEPYDRDALETVLTDCLAATPRHVRISRMVRDIPSSDVVAGGVANDVRSVIETKFDPDRLHEIRYRESLDAGECIEFNKINYDTSIGDEYFIEEVSGNRLLGYIRLLIPNWDALGGEFAAAALAAYGAPCAVVRELRVSTPVDKETHASHLLVKARDAVRESGYGRVAVGLPRGPHPFWKRAGYVRDGAYWFMDVDA